MQNKSKLDRTIEYGIQGIPELRPEERRKWLGEFRERVILGLTVEQSYMEEALYYAEDALNDRMAKVIIVNQNIAMDVIAKYMRLAKKIGKEFKSIATDNEEAMGVVVVSHEAVERENVEVEIERLPDSYKNINTNKICENCHKELSESLPRYKDKFRVFGFLDRVMQATCPVCNNRG